MLRIIVITAIVLASALANSAEKKEEQRIPANVTFTGQLMVSFDDKKTDGSAGVVVGNGQNTVKQSPPPDEGLTIEKIVYDKLAEELNRGQRPAGRH